MKLSKFLSKLKYLYHFTPKENIEDIKKNGLVSEKSKSSLEAIYLASEPFVAKQYESMHNKMGYVLEIDFSKLNQKYLIPDNYELQDYLNRPWDDNDEYEGLHWKDLTWEESLQLVQQCAYTKKIPPQAIKVLK